jgi:hypothetical protein
VFAVPDLDGEEQHHSQVILTLPGLSESWIRSFNSKLIRSSLPVGASCLVHPSIKYIIILILELAWNFTINCMELHYQLAWNFTINWHAFLSESAFLSPYLSLGVCQGGL